jgi:basic membrane lipoprotein Med (substrate-binding protein (PBP1-ABC) superfamily)
MKAKITRNSPRPRPGSLARIEKKLGIIIRNQEKAMSDEASALAALKQEIADLGTQMDANFQKLLAAVAANDPVAKQAVVDEINADVQALKDIGTRDKAP